MGSGCGVAVIQPPPPVCTDTLTHWQSPVISRGKKEKLSPHSQALFIVLSCVYMSKQNISCAVRCITRTRDKLLQTPHKNKCETPSPSPPARDQCRITSPFRQRNRKLSALRYMADTVSGVIAAIALGTSLIRHGACATRRDPSHFPWPWRGCRPSRI